MSDESTSGRQESDALLEQMRDLPCTVDQVTVIPAELQTRLLLVLREFKDARKATTFEEVLARTIEAVDNLDDLGVFKDAAARLGPGLPVRSHLLPAHSSSTSAHAGV